MSKLNWGKSAYSVVLLCAATAISSSAQTLTTLHSFDGTDGAGPLARLVQATDGNLYGTIPDGGASGGGTVFRITPSGTLTMLYSFCSQPNCTDGEFPVGGVIPDASGNLFGVTYLGGPNQGGTVFELSP